VQLKKWEIKICLLEILVGAKGCHLKLSLGLKGVQIFSHVQVMYTNPGTDKSLPITGSLYKTGVDTENAPRCPIHP